MCASGWYEGLKTASGSRTSLVLPEQVKIPSGGYLGQSPARVRVPDGWPAQFGWNGWKIILCGTRVRVGSDAGTALVWICFSGAEESTKTVHSGWWAFFAQQSKPPWQTPDSVITQRSVWCFPSGAGRASASNYCGSGRVRNVIPGYTRVRFAPGMVEKELGEETSKSIP